MKENKGWLAELTRKAPFLKNPFWIGFIFGPLFEVLLFVLVKYTDSPGDHFFPETFPAIVFFILYVFAFAIPLEISVLPYELVDSMCHFLQRRCLGLTFFPSWAALVFHTLGSAIFYGFVFWIIWKIWKLIKRKILTKKEK